MSYSTETIYCLSISDKRYLVPTCVTISSVCRHNTNCRIIYFVIVPGEFNDCALWTMLSEKYKNLEIKLINPSPSLLTGKLDVVYELRESLKNSRITIESYLRLFVTELLPPEVDVVLYLDSDILCRGELSELFKYQLNKIPIAGVCDSGENTCKARLNLKKYVNAGVILINLNYWRKQEVISLFYYIIKTKYRELLLHDQDVINLAFDSSILLLPEKWNFHGSLDKYANADQISQATLVHFIVEHKPWINGNMNPASALWIDEYELFFNKRFDYLSEFPLKIRVRNKLILMSYKVLPLGSKRREIVKKVLKMFS